jgi:hypothetical protein
MAARERLGRHETPQVRVDRSTLKPEDLAEGARRFAIGEEARRRDVALFSIREMADENWIPIRRLIDERFTHPSKTDELVVLELVLRRDNTETHVDREYPAISRGRAGGLLADIMNRIINDDVLMRRITYEYDELRKVRRIEPDALKSALHRMPAEYRDYIIDTFVAPNVATQDRFRDRKMMHEMFTSHASNSEIGARHGMNEQACSHFYHTMMQNLCERPLVRKLFLAWSAQMAKVKPMTPEEVFQRLRQLEGTRAREVINAIPIFAWNRRDSMPMHKQVTAEYFEAGCPPYGEFAGQFNARHSGAGLEQTLARYVVTETCKKISEEPTLVERLRIASGEMTESAIQKLRAGSLKPRGADIIFRKPEVKVKNMGHARAVLGSMVGNPGAFCSETGLSEEFLCGLGLDELRRALDLHGIRYGTALECFAMVSYRQMSFGQQALTTGGLSNALTEFRNQGHPVREIRTTSRRPIRLEPLDGGVYALCLGPNRSSEISDETLLQYAKRGIVETPEAAEVQRKPGEGARRFKFETPEHLLLPPVKTGFSYPETEALIWRIDESKQSAARERAAELRRRVDETTRKAAAEQEEYENTTAMQEAERMAERTQAIRQAQETERMMASVRGKLLGPAKADVKYPEVGVLKWPVDRRAMDEQLRRARGRLQFLRDKSVAYARRGKAEQGEYTAGVERAEQERMTELAATLKKEEEAKHVMNADEFNGMLLAYSSRFKTRLHMMDAAGLTRQFFTQAYGELLKSSPAVRTEGERILTFMPFLKTEAASNPELLEGILRHFQASWDDWAGRGITQEDLPRLALYKILAYEAGVSQEISTRKDETGVRYLRMGRDYADLVNSVPEGMLVTYMEIEEKYLKLMNSLDPMLRQKLDAVEA